MSDQQQTNPTASNTRELNTFDILRYARSGAGLQKSINRVPATYMLRKESRLLLKTFSLYLGVGMNTVLDALIIKLCENSGSLFREELGADSSFRAINDIDSLLNKIKQIDNEVGIRNEY